MKKINIMLLGAVGLLTASCAETIEPAMPQSNPQEEILKNVTVTSAKDGAIASDAVIQLTDYKTTGKVPVMKLIDATNLVGGVTVSYKIEISPNADFSESRILDTTPGTTPETKDIFYADVFDWNDAHISFFGRNPKKDQTVYYRVPVYLDLDGANFRYDSFSYYAATGTIKEMCIDSGFEIEESYYLLSDATSWQLDNAGEMAQFKFDHSDMGVYDDPVFTISFKVTKPDTYWKIAPQSIVGTTDWSKVVGTEINGDTAMDGKLTAENAQAGKIVEPGFYSLTINMESMTYELIKFQQSQILYTPGGVNGWNQENSAWLQLNGNDKYYYGLTPVDAQGFKICEQKKWDNSTDWGAANDAPALNGTFVLGSSGKDIKVPTPGLYWINVKYDPDTYALTSYELTQVTRVGVIGSFPASNWGSDIEMTSVDGGKTWTAEVTFTAGSQFKVRFNNDWAISLGGQLDPMIVSQDNVTVDEAGTYEMKLSLLGSAPRMILTKK